MIESIQQLEVEVGCKELVILLHAKGPCLSPVGVLIEDILHWTTAFHFLQFSFIKNSCNKVAQALATKLRPHCWNRYS